MRARQPFKYRIKYKDFKNKTYFAFAMSLAEAEHLAQKYNGTIQKRFGMGMFA